MAKAYVHPELKNLAAELDDDELVEIATQCIEAYKDDVQSRSGWDKMHEEWVTQFYQTEKPINPPWQGSSEESLPLLPEACIQYSARAKQALFPSRQFIKVIPTGKVDAASSERAERVETHLVWQCTVLNRRYKRDKFRLLLGQSVHGGYFTKVYWDPLKKKWVCENVRYTDLVVPYGTGPRDIEDVERKTQHIWMSKNRGAILTDKEFFIAPPEPFQGEQTPSDRAEDRAQGLTPSSRTDERDCLVLEQHTFLDLDEDGLAEPYIVSLCAQSEKVLRIAIRYDTDEAGNPTDNKEPVEYFTHYPYIENPDGFYGLGMGHLIAQLNKSANKLLRQTVDGGTLSTIGNNSGFISQQIAGPSGGQLEMKFGVYKKVPGGIEDFQKGIYQFKFQPPAPVLREVIELLMARSDRIASATEALTGQTDKVMQPTALMALVEQGLQVFSAVYEGVTESLGSELEKICRLNHKFMDPEEYYAVQDASGELQQLSVGRDDYTPDMQIMPICDPKQATLQQRMSKAEAEWQFLAQNMLVMNSPVHYYQASYDYLRAIGVENIGSKLPYPQGQTRVDDPMMENMLVMQEFPMIPMAFPDQDHAGHNQAHMMVLASDNKTRTMTPLQREMLMQHIKAHERLEKAMPNGGQGRVGPLAAAPGNGPAIGAPGAAVPGGSMETNLLDGAPADPAVGKMSGQTRGRPVRPTGSMGGGIAA